MIWYDMTWYGYRSCAMNLDLLMRGLYKGLNHFEASRAEGNLLGTPGRIKVQNVRIACRLGTWSSYFNLCLAGYPATNGTWKWRFSRHLLLQWLIVRFHLLYESKSWINTLDYPTELRKWCTSSCFSGAVEQKASILPQQMSQKVRSWEAYG